MFFLPLSTLLFYSILFYRLFHSITTLSSPKLKTSNFSNFSYFLSSNQPMEEEHSNTIFKPFYFPFLLLHQRLKSFILSILFSLPTSFFALLLLFLLSYNAFSVFSIHIPHKPLNLPHQKTTHTTTTTKLSSSVYYALKEEIPPTHFPLLHKFHTKRVKKHKRGLRSLRFETQQQKVYFFKQSLMLSAPVTILLVLARLGFS